MAWLGVLVDRPVLMRIAFSHFCRKAEWGLTQAGIAYEALEVPLARMGNARRANPAHGTVPVLRVGGRLLSDSHAILVWADEHRASHAAPLYPEDHALAVARWELWAGEELAPPVRREAYRALHAHPGLGKRYGLPLTLRAPVVAKRIFLAVLKHYKARRFEAEDPDSVRAAMAKVDARLQGNATGYLFGEHCTAADIATAAFLEPLTLLDAYHAEPSWPGLLEYVNRVRPNATQCAGVRRVREADWRAWEALAKASLASPQSEDAAAAA